MISSRFIVNSLTKSAILASFVIALSVYPIIWGHSSLVDQKLKSSTFGKHSLKHCKISKGSLNREKSRSRCLRLVVGMLDFSLMMEYFIPLASTLKQAVCSFGNHVRAISTASVVVGGGRSGKRVKFLFEEISNRSSSGHASESSSMKLSSMANK